MLSVDQGDVGYSGVSGPPGPQGPPVSDQLQSVFSKLYCTLFVYHWDDSIPYPTPITAHSPHFQGPYGYKGEVGEKGIPGLPGLRVSFVLLSLGNKVFS